MPLSGEWRISHEETFAEQQGEERHINGHPAAERYIWLWTDGDRNLLGNSQPPYKVMESQVAEKDSLISGYMNNSLLIANTMEKDWQR